MTVTEYIYDVFRAYEALKYTEEQMVNGRLED